MVYRTSFQYAAWRSGEGRTSKEVRFRYRTGGVSQAGARDYRMASSTCYGVEIPSCERVIA